MDRLGSVLATKLMRYNNVKKNQAKQTECVRSLFLQTARLPRPGIVPLLCGKIHLQGWQAGCSGSWVTLQLIHLALVSSLEVLGDLMSEFGCTTSTTTLSAAAASSSSSSSSSTTGSDATAAGVPLEDFCAYLVDTLQIASDGVRRASLDALDIALRKGGAGRREAIAAFINLKCASTPARPTIAAVVKMRLDEIAAGVSAPSDKVMAALKASGIKERQAAASALSPNKQGADAAKPWKLKGASASFASSGAASGAASGGAGGKPWQKKKKNDDNGSEASGAGGCDENAGGASSQSPGVKVLVSSPPQGKLSRSTLGDMSNMLSPDSMAVASKLVADLDGERSPQIVSQFDDEDEDFMNSIC